MITAEELEELAQRKNKAFEEYSAARLEFMSSRIRPAVDAAKISVQIQANADTRIPFVPFVVVEIFDKDLFGRTGPRTISISAYEMLQCPSAALSKAAGDILTGGIKVNASVFSSSSIDRIETAAVQAVLQDFMVRLKKNPMKPWLLKLKKAVDKALIEGVQAS